MWERYVADSMRSKATLSEQAAQRMRFKALTQNLAIRSKLIDSVFGSKTLKAKLAVQAYGFAQEYGMENDPVVLEALNQAYRHLYAPSESSIQGHQNSVKCVRYNLHDQAVYSVGNGGQILLHQENSWPAFRTLYSGSELFECLAFEPASSRMIVATREGRLGVINTDEIQPKLAWLSYTGIGEIKALEWTNLGVYALGSNGLLLKLSSRTLEIEQRLDLGQKALSMALESSGSYLYIGGENGRIWKVNSRQMDGADEWARLPLSRVVSLGMTPDEKRLLVGTDQGYLGAYSLDDVSAKPWVYSGHKASISSIDVSADGRWVATACLDGCVRLFDLYSPLTAPVEYVEHRSWVYDARFAYEGRALITAGKDRYMHRYEVSPAQIAAAVSLRMNGPMNESQWSAFVGSDIPFQPYIIPVQ
jgi:WD40 repeat protein